MSPEVRTVPDIETGGSIRSKKHQPGGTRCDTIHTR